MTIEGTRRPLWFTIDTGSSYTFLDEGVANELGLKPAGTSSVHGAGGGEVSVKLLENVAFRMPGLVASGFGVRLTNLQGLGFSHRIDGFFGYDLLAKLVVTSDVDRRRITFTDPSAFRYEGSGAILPLRFGGKRGRWIYIRGTVKVPGNPAEESEFFVDSGSQDAVDTPLLRKSTGPLREITTGQGLGASGPAGVTGQVEWLRLGPFEIRNAPSACCGTLEGTERMIGQAVLGRFRATFDYERKRLILEPGRRLSEPF